MNRSRPIQCARLRESALSLTEVLVTVGIITIVAALLLPVIARSQRKGREGSCRNNLRQLGIAFMLYCENNDDAFPAPGSRAIYGPQPEDWIWWQPSRDVNKSAIVPYLSGFQPRLFRCPQDQEAITLANGGTMPNGSTYAYSYSFTSYDLAGESNRGMSSITTREGKTYPFKLSSVNNPSGKIMLVDEDRKTLDDSRWVPRDAWGKVNAVAMRHDSKGVVVFADGHVETVPPSYGFDQQNSDPTF
jgi:prepilin-type processing-associated H-X9-DG protein